jgi:hypothetical protein
MNQELDHQIIELAASKLPLAEQARILCISDDSLQKRRKRLGLSKPGNDFSAAEEEHAKALLREGVSYKLVAESLTEKFGIPRTRSAIAGFASRRGLKTVKSPEAIQLEMKKARQKRALAQLASRQAKAKKKRKFIVSSDPTVKPPPDDMSKYDDVFTGHGKVLIDLESGQCRWPLSRVDGVATFCGCQISHKSYCETHYRKAYSPE